jgi:hypothetical protein
MDVKIKFSPIRHPESNPAERIMRELSKYFRIYCNTTHKKWPELVSSIERWLNSFINSATGYSPIELLSGAARPDVFKGLVNKKPDQLPQEETLPDKILKVYARLKLRSEKRSKRRKKGQIIWKPQLNDLVLVRCQPASDAAQGIIGKFNHPYEGPYRIQRIISPSIYELGDEEGKVRGNFNLKHMKPYIQKQEEEN